VNSFTILKMSNHSKSGKFQKLIMLPGPTNVPIEVVEAMTSPIIGHRTNDFSSLMDKVVHKGNTLFECDENIVILTASGTAAVEASITNILRKGDKAIVTVCGEFGSRVSEQISGVGASPIQLVADYGDYPSLSDLERALETNPDTKAVYIVTNETSSGAMCNWLKEAGDLTSKYGAFLVADAISNWGADKMPLRVYNIDCIDTCSQKSIAAPPGLALISISTKYKDQIFKTKIGELECVVSVKTLNINDELQDIYTYYCPDIGYVGLVVKVNNIVKFKKTLMNYDFSNKQGLTVKSSRRENKNSLLSDSYGMKIK